jgi:hypothetical protein
MLTGLWAVLKAIGPGLGAVVTGGMEAYKRHQEINAQKDAARADLEIAELKARAELAVWRVKADVEWDLKWADQARTSWKDELLVILWSLPLIAIFIPGLRSYVIDGFQFLKAFNPDAPSWYMAGWAIIFAAVFGMKQALAFMLPARTAALASALGSLKDDIPPEAATTAQAKVSQR